MIPSRREAQAAAWRQALERWRTARAAFDAANDDDAVDVAVWDWAAAEASLRLVLREARRAWDRSA